jgi:hypothetical protein
MGFIIEFMKCLKKKNIVINLSLRKLVEYSFIKEIIEMLKKNSFKSFNYKWYWFLQKTYIFIDELVKKMT